MSNIAILGNISLKETEKELRSRLPADWRIDRVVLEPGKGSMRPDAIIEVRSPSAETAKLLIEFKKTVEPKNIPIIVGMLKAFAKNLKNSSPVLVVPFLTLRTREKLKEVGLNYLDFAGNSWIVLQQPGLFIETTGKDKNPWREKRPLRTLQGAVAGRIVRSLCDFLPPAGVRELAARTKANPGYVSRVIELLEREDFIVREKRGPITKVDWKGLIKRWANEYFPFEKNRALMCLDPNGLIAFTRKLEKSKMRYAITGSLAASRIAPIAPPRLAIVYVDDPREALSKLNLRQSEAGANVMLVVPFDEAVYEGTWSRAGLQFTSLSQTAVDLLKSPGRGPQEAEALLEVMKENEKRWRS